MTDTEQPKAKSVVMLTNGERIKCSLTVAEVQSKISSFVTMMVAKRQQVDFFPIPVPSGRTLVRRIDLIIGIEDYSEEEHGTKTAVHEDNIDLSTDQDE